MIVEEVRTSARDLHERLVAKLRGPIQLTSCLQVCYKNGGQHCVGGTTWDASQSLSQEAVVNSQFYASEGFSYDFPLVCGWIASIAQ